MKYSAFRIFSSVSQLRKHLRERRAFTIIEFMVAVALFSIVISIAMGSFVRALRTQRQLVALMASNSNVSLAIEQMAREIRTGHNFCLGSCAGSPDTLLFTNRNGQQIIYCKEANVIKRGVNTASCTNAQKITSDKVDVGAMQFIGRGMNAGDNYPPRITISVTISPQETGVETSKVFLQTTVSARFFYDT